MNNEEKIYTEYGLDFDNNKFGFGRSIEIEKNGKEVRTKKYIKIKNNKKYFRFWIFKKVIIISSKGIEIISKSRNNFKIIFGISGYPEEKSETNLDDKDGRI
jgi:hypothetical protein